MTKRIVVGSALLLAISACGGDAPPPKHVDNDKPVASAIPTASAAPVVDHGKEIQKLAAEAYIAGYPAIFMERQKRAMTTNIRIPLGTFSHTSKLPRVEDADVFPSLDTLLSSAWLELGEEAWVLKVPDMGARWFAIQLYDGYGATFGVVGSHATGSKAQTIALTGPNFKGAVPAGAKEIKSPTKTVWLLGRTRVNGDADLTRATGLLKQWSLLTAAGKKGDAMPAAPVGRPQDLKFAGPELFDELGEILKADPPPADVKWDETFAKAGIGPGLSPSKTLKQEEVASLAQGIKDGHEQLEGALEKLATRKNGWDMDSSFGPRAAPLRQAAYVMRGLDWPVATEGLIMLSRVDDGDRTLSGAHEYVIHFEKGKLPPADAFYTITMHSKAGGLVPNPKNRFLLEGSALKKNADGSADVTISADAPKDPTNWLPAPKGEAFMLALRIYQPSAAGATWEPPPVKRTK